MKSKGEGRKAAKRPSDPREISRPRGLIARREARGSRCVKPRGWPGGQKA